ncbi:DUF2969 domain-containing protein [Loigolactobacillus bifermentans]|jgi:hypothetical protein|uniref:DUF2969 domain-containing protein n=1 Tax=Loigolactobacillus bifermentans DSM 20003 TaxID=1423726 RepID=A0A0R1H6D4_9LACO|nr:DUF2969 domain-containing protein [Loigolactobacillus bifermentans]KRK39018.1 hypothetical protein FC07_GL002738 [Loigolactobacillus bifermentans DSM 20003]
MAKQPTKIELKLQDEQLAGKTVQAVFDGKKQIGTIEEVDARHFQVLRPSGDTFIARSFNDGLNELIMAYHLHK